MSPTIKNEKVKSTAKITNPNITLIFLVLSGILRFYQIISCGCSALLTCR